MEELLGLIRIVYMVQRIAGSAYDMTHEYEGKKTREEKARYMHKVMQNLIVAGVIAAVVVLAYVQIAGIIVAICKL